MHRPAVDWGGRIVAEQFTDNVVCITIYVMQQCANCAYAYTVAEEIRRAFPQVMVRFVDMAEPGEEIPEIVFATPTYLLNGRLWSLGNPSPTQVFDTLRRLTAASEGVTREK